MIFYALIFHMFLGMSQTDSWLQMIVPEDIPIWPNGAKVLSDQSKNLGESKEFSENSATEIRNPTMKIYYPKRNSSHAAVIVFPGGGYKALAIGKDSALVFLGLGGGGKAAPQGGQQDFPFRVLHDRAGQPVEGPEGLHFGA